MDDVLVAAICDGVLNQTGCEDFTNCIPDFDTAYALQDAVVARLVSKLGAVAGYKIAWNSAEQIKALAPNAPAVGQIFAGFVKPSGTHFVAGELKQLVVEPEIIAVIGQDINGDTHTAASIAPAIARVHAGFEIMERRNTVDPTLSHPPSIVANNIFNNGMVMGTGQEMSGFDPVSIATVLTVNGEVVLNAKGAAPQSPELAVANVANTLAARGKFLKAGDLVLCGTHFPPFEIYAGAELSVQMDGLSADFSFG